MSDLHPRAKEIVAGPGPQSFRPAGGWRIEGFAPKLSFNSLLTLQVGIGIPWVLCWGTILCDGAGAVSLWLPLNYLLLDLYLLARGGLDRPALEKSSRWAAGLLRASPFAMAFSAFVLGMVGTGLHEAIS